MEKTKWTFWPTKLNIFNLQKMYEGSIDSSYMLYIQFLKLLTSYINVVIRVLQRKRTNRRQKYTELHIYRSLS